MESQPQTNGTTQNGVMTVVAPPVPVREFAGLKLAGAVMAVLVPLAAALVFAFDRIDSKIDKHAERPHVGAVSKEEYDRDRKRMFDTLDRIESKVDRLQP